MKAIQKLIATNTAIALLLFGCGYQSVSLPTVRLNPSPQITYKVSMALPAEIHLAINPFAVVTYSAVNQDECVPIDKGRSLGGSRPILRHFINSSQFVQDRNGNYSGVIYADQLANENYYGLGTCQWELNMVAVQFATINSKNVAAIVAIHRNFAKPQTQIFSCRRQTMPNDLAAETCFPAVAGVPGNFLITIYIENLVAHNSRVGARVAMKR